MVAAGGASAIGLDCASAEARFAAELFEHRYVNYNDILSWWGLDKSASEGPPLALIFEYYEGVKVDEPYAGGMIFKEDAVWLSALMRYGQRFSALFERDVGISVLAGHARSPLRAGPTGAASRLGGGCVRDPRAVPALGSEDHPPPLARGCETYRAGVSFGSPPLPFRRLGPPRRVPIVRASLGARQHWRPLYPPRVRSQQVWGVPTPVPQQPRPRRLEGSRPRLRRS